jgi:hypothetical protein
LGGGIGGETDTSTTEGAEGREHIRGHYHEDHEEHEGRLLVETPPLGDGLSGQGSFPVFSHSVNFVSFVVNLPALGA